MNMTTVEMMNARTGYIWILWNGTKCRVNGVVAAATPGVYEVRLNRYNMSGTLVGRPMVVANGGDMWNVVPQPAMA